jgi:DNA repair exonuclease SbcCD ATPase subunit
MTDTVTEIDPEALRRELIKLFAEPKSLHHIVSAGLEGVRRQLAELCEAIEGAENGADQVVATVAELANLVRQEQRKHGGAVTQARKEHQRADAALTLLAEVLREFREEPPGSLWLRSAIIPTARVERWRTQANALAPGAAEHSNALAKMEQRWQGAVREARNHKARAERLATELEALRGQVRPVQARVNESHAQAVRARGEARDALALHAQELRARSEAEIGWREALDEVERLRAKLAAHRPAAEAPVGLCWCGHDSDAHVIDGGDNAVCRGCMTVAQVHRAFHVHAPEASR